MVQTCRGGAANPPTRPQSTISSFYGAAMATSVGGCSKRLRDQNITATASGLEGKRAVAEIVASLALHPFFAFDKVIFTVLASRQQQQSHFSPSPTRQRSVSDGRHARGPLPSRRHPYFKRRAPGCSSTLHSQRDMENSVMSRAQSGTSSSHASKTNKRESLPKKVKATPALAVIELGQI